jgi:cytochrome c oxidase subunit 3
VLFGLAVLNAQVYVYNTMGLVISEEGYAVLVYAITGAFLVALVGGIVFAGLVAFRELGGRYSGKEHDGVSALALYWYFLTVAFAGVWLVIYVIE